MVKYFLRALFRRWLTFVACAMVLLRHVSWFAQYFSCVGSHAFSTCHWNCCAKEWEHASYNIPARRRPILKRSLEKRPKRESWDLLRDACCSRGSRCAQPRNISFYRYFHTFLKRSNLEWQDILMHNLCTISDLTVDKPWNDLSRAWNDLSRAWTVVPEFSTDFFFLLRQKFWIPKKKCNMWVSIWILLMAQEFKTYSFKMF